MIDIKLIRENSDLVKENIKKRFQSDKLILVDKVKALDENWRKQKFQADKLRAKRNNISKEIAKAKKLKNKKLEAELIKKAKEIPNKIKKIQEKIVGLKEQIKEIMYKIPSMMHESVPIGKNESENVEIKRIGIPKIPEYKILNHIELIEKSNLADFELARKTSGKGFLLSKRKTRNIAFCNTCICKRLYDQTKISILYSPIYDSVRSC